MLSHIRQAPAASCHAEGHEICTAFLPRWIAEDAVHHVAPAFACFKCARAQVIHYDIKSSNVLLDTLSKHVVRAHCYAPAWPLGRSRTANVMALNLALSWCGRPNGTQASLNLWAVRAQTAKIADVGLSRVMQATLATLTDGHFMRGCVAS